MAKEKNSPSSQYLVSYVTKLQQLNEIEIEVPQEITIDDILADPMSYALGLAEREFERHAPRFSEAFTLGQTLANDNIKGG